MDTSISMLHRSIDRRGVLKGLTLALAIAADPAGIIDAAAQTPFAATLWVTRATSSRRRPVRSAGTGGRMTAVCIRPGPA